MIVYLASKFANLRILFIVTYRPSEMHLGKHPFLQIKPELQSKGLCREIALRFLDEEDVAKYLKLQFSSNRFPADFPAFIYSKTEGNPLFMVDMVRYLQDLGMIVETQGIWRLAQELSNVGQQLPESVRGMIQTKLHGLSEAERLSLSAASIQGQEFDGLVLSDVLRKDPAATEQELDQLDRLQGLFRLAGEKEFPDGAVALCYRFVHILYQNALQSSLGPARRAELSASVAASLLNHYGEQSWAIASELAALYETARDFWRASEHFLIAARHSSQVFAYREAVALARRGLDCLRRVSDTPKRAAREFELMVALGVPLAAVQGYANSEVIESFDRARKIGEELGETTRLFPVLWWLWLCRLSRADMDQAERLAEDLLALAREVGDSGLLVEAHWSCLMTYAHEGYLPLAVKHMEAGIAAYDPAQHRSHISEYGHDPGVGLRCHGAWATWTLGRSDLALTLITEALVLAKETSHPNTLAMANFFAAAVRLFRREPLQGREHHESMITLCDEHGLISWLAWGTMTAGLALIEEGRTAEAIQEIRECLARYWTNTGINNTRPTVLCLLADAYLKEGLTAEGLAAVNEGLLLVERTRQGIWEPELYRVKGELLWHRQGSGKTLHQTICWIATAWRCSMRPSIASDVPSRSPANKAPNPGSFEPRSVWADCSREGATMMMPEGL